MRIRTEHQPLAHRRAFYIGKQIADFADEEYYFLVEHRQVLFKNLRKAAAHSWARGGKSGKIKKKKRRKKNEKIQVF